MLLSLLLHGDAAPATGWFGYDAARFHAMLNDFPAALLVVGVLFELAFLVTKRESLRGAGYWALVAGAVGAGLAVLSGLKAENSIQHGEAIHEIMKAHQRLGYITLAVFGVIAIWLVLRDAKMARAERWVLALAGVVGLGVLVATGREGGELVFDHAAGMRTEAMEAEIKNRAAGHEHAEGEEHEHAPGEEHDDDAMPAAGADSTAEHQHTDSAASAGATDSAKPKPTHTHAPGTPPHQD